MFLTCKLKRGVGVNKYIPTGSFGDRPNRDEVGTVVKCNIQKRSSPEARPVYIFPTTLTVIFSESYLFMTRFVKDTTTATILFQTVCEGVQRANIVLSQLIWAL